MAVSRQQRVLSQRPLLSRVVSILLLVVFTEIIHVNWLLAVQALHFRSPSQRLFIQGKGQKYASTTFSSIEIGDTRRNILRPLSDSSAGSVAAGGASKDADDGGSKQSLSVATFNLAKACLGSGLLSISAGAAAIGDVPKALVPASVLLSSLGILSGYTFYSIGKVCEEEQAGSFGEAWEKLFGEKTAWVVTLSCFLTPLGAALAYSIILGDFLSSLAKSAGLKGILATRHASIVAVTCLFLYPLCSLRSLAALSPVSIVGIVSVLLTCVFMAIRAVDGTYGPSGVYSQTMAKSLQPSFAKIGTKVMSPSILVLTSMAATAYLVHFLAPEFYNDLRDKNLKSFRLLSTIGFGVTSVVSVLFMCLGFLSFGGNASGMILNNFSTADFGASICRLLMAISLIGSYPFLFSAIRSNYVKMTTQGQKLTDSSRTKTTVLLLGITTAMALALDNVGFVASFNGALMGSAIIYIFPSLMFLKSTHQRLKLGKLKKTRGLTIERIFNKFLIGLGATFAIMGGGVSILSAFFPHLL